jgi:4-alpha-glucanotransferase
VASITTEAAEQAARLGIIVEYRDGLGRLRTADPEALARITEALSSGPPPRPSPSQGQGDVGADLRPAPTEAPICCWQGEAVRGHWALAVQLYGVRSGRNWGHGDFTDLLVLIDLAADLGAGGIGLNPLHALFDAEASPYSPSSRQFLNARYIDVEAIAEFPGLRAAGLEDRIAALRASDLIDYDGVAAAKEKALRLAYNAFRRSGDRERLREFDEFCESRGAPLAQFAAFEALRCRFGRPWWRWPEEFRAPVGAGLRPTPTDDVGYFAFVQWIAHEQLERCRERAAARGLPIGLYLDIAVGARADGYDAWGEQDTVLAAVELGAPPDMLNTAGQRWGIAGTNPIAAEANNFGLFRRVLAAAMRYAGAIRLDHVMGLERQFLVPNAMPADRGLYVRSPFRALLAVTARESLAHRSIVIGEDLGTVPDNFRETLGGWGIWSYQVAIFERKEDGSFRPPEEYRENALATFSTHDLPTFAGWISGADLAIKRALGLDPGETEEERRAAVAALEDAVGAGLRPAPTEALRNPGARAIDFLSVLRWLAASPSRLLVVSMEDALGIVDQVNVPGTVDEHPNWRRRLPVALEDLAYDGRLAALAEAMMAARRRVGS